MNSIKGKYIGNMEDYTEDYPVSEYTKKSGVKTKAHTRGEEYIESPLEYTEKGRIKAQQMINGEKWKYNIRGKTYGEAKILRKQVLEYSGRREEKVYKHAAYQWTMKEAIIVKEIGGRGGFVVLVHFGEFVEQDSVGPKIKRWITVKGSKVPIYEGESIQEAIEKRTSLEKTPVLNREEKVEKVEKKIVKKTKIIKKEGSSEKKKVSEERTKEKIEKKKKQLDSKLKTLQVLNTKIYKSPILNAIIDTFFAFIETGKLNTVNINRAIRGLRESKRIKKEKKEKIINQIESIRIEISKMYEKKDMIHKATFTKQKKKAKVEHIGNINGILSDDITQDFINSNDLSDITQDFSEQEEDFTILHGPITRAGAFEYEKNGHQVIYYKDWENIKEVFGKREYIPLKASTKRDSHHADILGYATNWKPNDITEQMFADVVLFKDINEVTTLLNPENGYQVSIGFKDRIEDNIQWLVYVDHLALSLLNKDTGRCLTANGKSCFAKQKEMNN